MFYFRINRVRLVNNRESKFLGILGTGLAQVKIFSFITTNDSDFPELDALSTTTDEAKQKEGIRAAVERVVASRILTQIDNVRDNHVLTFGDTGYVLFQSEKIPRDFNWNFIAIESDRNVRQIGKEMENVVKHPGFDSFASQLIHVMAGAANPTYLAGVEIGKFITQVMADNLKRNEDDQIGILYMSLNRQEHYLHGERKADAVPDLTGNMFIDYSLFGFE